MTKHGLASHPPEGSTRCYGCFRPIQLCFCDGVPRIENRVEVLIFQHVRERWHAFNTARIVSRSLQRCRLIVDHTQGFAKRDLPVQDDAVLLYPDQNAPPVSELRHRKPTQLVIIDGTWHQAKTIVRDLPQLKSLRRVRIQPPTPGQYRIRREPDDQSLSTLEATVAALGDLEPETVGLGQLLNVFHRMVADQLAQSGARMSTRVRQNRGPLRHLPRAFSDASNNLVVAYGEARPHVRGKPPWPISWVAQRLGTQETFTALLEQPEDLPTATLKHLKLTTQDFEKAISPEEFRRRWNSFLNPEDVLVVYHARTYRLLNSIEADQPRCLVLKSVFGHRHSQVRSLEAMLAAEGLRTPSLVASTRAHERLAMAMELVRHLTRIPNLADD